MPLNELFEVPIKKTATLPHAHIITSDQEAIDIAREFAAKIAATAADRDRSRSLPFFELDEFSQTGLWGITIPKEFGGADVSKKTLCNVIQIVSEADPCIGQIPQSHFCFVEDVKLVGSQSQKSFFFDRILSGDRTGNAFSEKNGKTVGEMTTKIVPTETGDYVLSGEKFYSTGALFAQWIPVFAVDPDGRGFVAVVDRHTEGITVIDDWDGFGQRTTASGTVRIENVVVKPEFLLPIHLAFGQATNGGPHAQILHVAVDAGIAQAAVKETIQIIRHSSRPWIDAQVERASDDPLTLGEVGNLEYLLHAAEALLDRAARILQESFTATSDDSVSRSSIAVAEAKIATTEIALLASSKLCELGGTRTASQKLSLDRHWRNARTHTLHDPVRWKYYAVGNYYLNGRNPPRNAWN